MSQSKFSSLTSNSGSLTVDLYKEAESDFETDSSYKGKVLTISFPKRAPHVLNVYKIICLMITINVLSISILVLLIVKVIMI